MRPAGRTWAAGGGLAAAEPGEEARVAGLCHPHSGRRCGDEVPNKSHVPPPCPAPTFEGASRCYLKGKKKKALFKGHAETSQKFPVRNLSSFPEIRHSPTRSSAGRRTGPGQRWGLRTSWNFLETLISRPLLRAKGPLGAGAGRSCCCGMQAPPLMPAPCPSHPNVGLGARGPLGGLRWPAAEPGRPARPPPWVPCPRRLRLPPGCRCHPGDHDAGTLPPAHGPGAGCPAALAPQGPGLGGVGALNAPVGPAPAWGGEG